MNKTTNYQLNQWERADRVLMEDFNADNEKIDAAIKAVDTKADSLSSGKANQSALTALQNTVNTVSARAGVRKLKTGTPLATDAASYDISFDGIDCSQWKTLYLVIDIKASSSVNIGHGTQQSQATLYPGKNLLIFYPFFDNTVNATAFYPAGGIYGNYIAGISAFKNYRSVVFGNSGKLILAGTTYEVWGEK